MSEFLEEDSTITVTADDGTPVVCDVLLTFDSDDTGCSYVVFTDNSVDAEGKVQVSARRYRGELSSAALEELTEEAEWDMVNEALQEALGFAQRMVQGEG